MSAYEECLTATSTRYSPWYVVPADDKENARLIISAVIFQVFAGLKMSYPKADKKRQQELSQIRKKLAKARRR